MRLIPQKKQFGIGIEIKYSLFQPEIKTFQALLQGFTLRYDRQNPAVFNRLTDEEYGRFPIW